MQSTAIVIVTVWLAYNVLFVLCRFIVTRNRSTRKDNL